MRLPSAIILAAILAAGCGDTASSSDGCGRAVHEDLDPLSGLHPIGATDVIYQTSPPTSGPHLSIVGPTGVSEAQLEPIMQVTVLARGAVLVQYRDPAAAETLAPLADRGDIVVAPAPDLDEAVVATAWTVKLRCEAVDVDAIAAFFDAQVGSDHH